MSCSLVVGRDCSDLEPEDSSVSNILNIAFSQDATSIDINWDWFDTPATVIFNISKGEEPILYEEASSPDTSINIVLLNNGLYTVSYRVIQNGLASRWGHEHYVYLAGATGVAVEHVATPVLQLSDIVVHTRQVSFMQTQLLEDLITNQDDPAAPGTKYNISN